MPNTFFSTAFLDYGTLQRLISWDIALPRRDQIYEVVYLNKGLGYIEAATHDSSLLEVIDGIRHSYQLNVAPLIVRMFHPVRKVLAQLVISESKRSAGRTVGGRNR